MSDNRNKRQGKRSIPATCAHCGGPLRAHRSSERALIRCEWCGERIFSFYTEPPSPDEEDDPPGRSRAEAKLLQAVTPQAQAVYEVLRVHITRYGYAPTVREIAQALSIHSANTIAHHLDALEGCGLIERDPGRARAIRLPYAS